MKSILISIKPKWVAKILNGEKTIEIRKTFPKCDLPIDVYIYCTKDLKSGKKVLTWLNEKGLSKVKTITYLGNDILGKVVAKFTLNKVEDIEYLADDYCTETYRQKELIRRCCLTDMELNNYLEHKTGYAWYIDNLVIFDRPKELSEFWNCAEKVCLYNKNKNKCHKGIHCRKYLTKAPQSYCFVEKE